MQARHPIMLVALLSLSALVVDNRTAGAVGGPGFGCTTHANTFFKSGSILTVRGSQSCDGQLSGFAPRQLTMRIERSRWFGWEVMSSSWSSWRIPAFYSEVQATYNCGGTGTHTFRGEASGTIFPGMYNTSEFFTIRWSC